MAKQKVLEARFDFTGGRNVAVNPDRLSATELVESLNTRIEAPIGALAKRTGSRRMHSTEIGGGAAVLGLVQWDAPSGKQIVAIADGKLYHKTSAFGEFAEVVPDSGDEFSTTAPAHFATFRDKTQGAPLRLYIASGGKVYIWDGSSLSRIDGTNEVPPAGLVKQYHTRLFMDHVELPKHLFWSTVGLGTDFVPGSAIDAGQGMVNVLDGDALIGLEVVGSSLLIATRNSIARFTGYSADDIQLAADTEGLSSTVGIVGSRAWHRVDNAALLLSDRGAHLATEAGLQSIGIKVEPDFRDMNRSWLANVAVGDHRGRREGWFAYRRASDPGNNSVLVYNYRFGNWYGPFTYPFDIVCFARYEDPNGEELLMAGCGDGFVRLMDNGSRDDMLADGSGGSAYIMQVELAPMFFDAGPAIAKSIYTVALQATLPATHNLKVRTAFDDLSFDEVDVEGNSDSPQHFRVDVNGVGCRLRLQLVDDSDELPVVHGLVVYAYDMQRPCE